MYQVSTISNDGNDGIFRNLGEFLYDIRYIIMFYVLGDFFTTAGALGYGVEENLFISYVLSEFGIWAFFGLKMLFIMIVYCVYKDIRKSGSVPSMQVLKASKFIMTFAGIFLVVNNSLVMWGSFSLLQLLGMA